MRLVSNRVQLNEQEVQRMTHQLRLMCVLAHPDDDSLGTGGILAKYAAEGGETYLITATRDRAGSI
jgi:LmbE family N-acetylglucosaminyl deacetylase